MSDGPERSAGQAPVEQDLPFQQRQWTIQRWGWALMTLLIAAALAGLLGAGPLANAGTETLDGGLRLEYQRFARAQAPNRLVINLAATDQEEVAVWIDGAFLDRIEIESIDPEPVSVRGGERQVFAFAVAAGEPEIEVRIGYRPEDPGLVAGTMGLPGGESIEFTQLVYP